ncbi:MAG TPA: HAD family hydrolase, partial [Actinoplanes sp.]|nr:HAD family hydrolase [Actinoplanes sp.]
RWQRREITFQGQRRERVREFLGRDLTDTEADELFAGYLARYEAGWAAFDDALPTLHRFREAGVTVAVLTNGDEDQQRDKLERTGLAGGIDVLIASSALPAGKPDPRAFQHALARLGVAAEQALMIGDSLEKDVRGALATGLPAILLDRFGAHPDAGVPTIRTLNEAPTALR